MLGRRSGKVSFAVNLVSQRFHWMKRLFYFYVRYFSWSGITSIEKLMFASFFWKLSVFVAYSKCYVCNRRNCIDVNNRPDVTDLILVWIFSHKTLFVADLITRSKVTNMHEKVQWKKTVVDNCNYLHISWSPYKIKHVGLHVLISQLHPCILHVKSMQMKVLKVSFVL